jgi:hypothetical protein
MKRRIFILLISIFSWAVHGQKNIKAFGALSVIEHASVGVSVQLGRRHTISGMFGSNLFFGYHKFSNLLLQYDFTFLKLARGKITPKFGVRGGDSYFSDTYYRWHVMNIIPVLGANYGYSQKVSLFAEAGVAIAFLQSVERVKAGEIGIYRQYLPELKIGISYTLYEKKKK